MARIRRLMQDPLPPAVQPQPGNFGAAQAQGLAQVGESVQNIAQVGAQVVRGYQESKLRTRQGELETRAGAIRDEVNATVRFDERQDAFKERYDTLRDEIRQDLDGGYARRFDGFARVNGLEQERLLNAEVLADTQDADKGELEMYLRNRQQKAASGSEFEQHVAALEARGAIRGFGDRWGLDETAENSIMENWERGTLDATFEWGIRNDPWAAYEALSQEGEGLAKYLTPLERQQKLSRSVDAIKAQASAALTRESQEYARDERIRKQVAESAEKALIADALTGDGITYDEVEMWKWALNAETYGHMLEIASTGGRIDESPVAREAALSLRRAAQAGEVTVDEVPFSAALDNAFLRGDITYTELGQFEKMSRDARFATAIDLLDERLKIPELVQFTDFQLADQKTKNADARLKFSRWMAANPNASRTEAEEIAISLADRAWPADEKIESINVPAGIVYGEDGRVGYAESERNITTSGLPDDAKIDALRRLRAIAQMQGVQIPATPPVGGGQ